MKELSFFLSTISRVIFNDAKYKDIKNLDKEDLLSIEMLMKIKDSKEMELMKEQFLNNQKVVAVQQASDDKKSEEAAEPIVETPEKQNAQAPIETTGNQMRQENLYSKYYDQFVSNNLKPTNEE